MDSDPDKWLSDKINEMILGYNETRVWMKHMCTTNKGLADATSELNKLNLNMARSYKKFILTMGKVNNHVKKLTDVKENK